MLIFRGCGIGYSTHPLHITKCLIMIHLNTKKRIEKVCEIAQKYYEPGNAAKCYRAVWRHHIYPIYPMCYRTFLSYLYKGGIQARKYKY